MVMAEVRLGGRTKLGADDDDDEGAPIPVAGWLETTTGGWACCCCCCCCWLLALDVGRSECDDWRDMLWWVL